MPPPSASLQCSSPTHTPALQQTVDQITARRGATEASADKTAEQIFPQLPYLMTERSSCFELHFYSERTLAERQADFHRRLCARLGDVAQQQRDHQRRLAIGAEAGLSPRSDYLARARYIDAEDSPLTPSRIEILDDEVDGDEDDGLVLNRPKLIKQEDNLELP